LLDVGPFREPARLLELGRYVEASEEVERILDSLAPGSHRALAEGLRIRAELAIELGVPEAAADYASRALSIDEQLGQGAETISADLDALGVASVLIGQFDAATVHLERAVRLRATTIGADAELTLASRLNLAVAIDRLGDRSIALDAVEGVAATSQPRSRSRAVAQNILAGWTATDPNRRDLAEGLYLEAYRAAVAAYGTGHPAAAKISVNLARREVSSDPERAVARLVAADEVFRRAYGPDHVQNAVGLIILSAAYRRLGDHGVEKSTLDRALRLRLDALGPRDPATLQVIRPLIAALADLGRHDPLAMLEASLLARIQAPRDDEVPGRSAFSPERADRELWAYIDRASQLTPEADWTPAGPYAALRTRSAGDIAALATNSPDWRWIGPLRRLARERNQAGEAADGLRLSELAVDVMSRVYGRDHPAVVLERTRLANALSAEYGPRAGLATFEVATRSLAKVPGMPPGLAEGALAAQRAMAARQAEDDVIGITRRRALAREAIDSEARAVLGTLAELDLLVAKRDLSEWEAIKSELPLLLSTDPLVIESAAAVISRLLFEGSLHSSAAATFAALQRIAARPGDRRPRELLQLEAGIIQAAKERPGRRPAWVEAILSADV
jgi:hypothetical protein